MSLPSLADLATGKWKGILAQLGVDAKTLSGRHGPCPFCGGEDRFRFTNHKGTGFWICNQCGQGDGAEFVIRKFGVGFCEAAEKVKSVLGIVQADKLKAERTTAQQERAMADLWARSSPITADSIVARYMASRAICCRAWPKALRGIEGKAPMMLAQICDAGGNPAQVHRTFLRPDGQGKADVPAPRKLMPGVLPPGSAVRLCRPGNHLGIAEGIETALSAMALFRVPVWALINAGNLEQFALPDGISQVTIFGDNDASFTGQHAAHALAHRLSRSVAVEVRIPEKQGDDWNDVLIRRTQEDDTLTKR